MSFHFSEDVPVHNVRKPDVVPHVFLWSNCPSQSQVSRAERAEKWLKTEIKYSEGEEDDWIGSECDVQASGEENVGEGDATKAPEDLVRSAAQSVQTSVK